MKIELAFEKSDILILCVSGLIFTMTNLVHGGN